MKRTSLIVLALFVVLVVAGCGGGDGATVEFGPNDAPSPDDGVVQVALVWDEPVDLDLEVWDKDGVSPITAASIENGVDVFDGTEGAEYVDFTDEAELSSGTYVVSVYFAEEAGDIGSAEVQLIITDSDGDVSEYEGTALWEEGKDQWHAFEIDGATGEYSEIDEYIEITVSE